MIEEGDFWVYPRMVFNSGFPDRPAVSHLIYLSCPCLTTLRSNFWWPHPSLLIIHQTAQIKMRHTNSQNSVLCTNELKFGGAVAESHHTISLFKGSKWKKNSLQSKMTGGYFIFFTVLFQIYFYNRNCLCIYYIFLFSELFLQFTPYSLNLLMIQNDPAHKVAH